MIVTNGDSFTQEIYLDIKDRWTTKIGVSHNLAMGGGSHERVLKTSIEALNSYNVKVLIIGWPTPDRTMMPLSNGSIAMLGAIQSIDENTTEDHHYMSKFYIKYCYNSFYHFKQRLEYMIFLQNYCFAKQIKILYFMSTKEIIDEKHLLDLSRQAFINRSKKDIENAGIKYSLETLKKLMDKIENKIWIKNPWYSMNEHCKNFPRKNCGHPAEEGSEHWSNLVKTYL